jgi:hypothetical protein
MFMRVPMAAMVTIIFEPPALISGNAFPAKGKRLTMTAIFTNASQAIHRLNPAASRAPI